MGYSSLMFGCRGLELSPCGCPTVLLSFCQWEVQLLVGSCFPCMGTSRHPWAFSGSACHTVTSETKLGVTCFTWGLPTTTHVAQPHLFIYIPWGFLGPVTPRMHRTHCTEVETEVETQQVLRQCSLNEYGSFGGVWYTLGNGHWLPCH